MPFQPLLTHLNRSARGRVLQLDRPLPPDPPTDAPGMTEAAWQTFRTQVKERDLYFELTIPDHPPALST